MIRIAYICDRKRGCSRYEHCGVDCFHTFDEFHTANGILRNIADLETDRFRVVGGANEDIYYEEVIKDK